MTQTTSQPPFTRPDTLQLRPRTLQFFIDNLPLLTLDLCGYAWTGMDGMLFMRLLLWLSVAMSLVLAYRFIYLKRMIYRITDEQLIYEHGVITRSSDYVELYRVVDFAERSNLMQQHCGLKTVSVHSGDRNTHRLDIIGMDMNNDLVSVIRRRVELNKRRKGIYEITNR